MFVLQASYLSELHGTGSLADQGHDAQSVQLVLAQLNTVCIVVHSGRNIQLKKALLAQSSFRQHLVHEQPRHNMQRLTRVSGWTILHVDPP